MKLKRLSALGSALVLSISTLLSIGFAGTAFAAAPYTCTWTGATNNNFNTAGNWTGCNSAAPQPADNDNLVFSNTSLSAEANLVNDITGLQVNSITFSGTNSSYYGYAITGNSISISGGITQSANTFSTLDVSTLTLSGSQTFSLSNAGLTIGDSTQATSSTLSIGSNTLTISDSTSCTGLKIYSALTGSGTITDNTTTGVSLNTDSPSFSGAINVSSGYLSANSGQALGASSATVSIASGASLFLGYTSNVTYAENLNLNGSGVSSGGTVITGQPALYGAQCAGGVGTPTTSTATLSGNVTLLSNSTVYTGQYNNLDVTGPLSGSYTLTSASGSAGTLTVNSSNNTSQTPNGNQSAPAVTTNYDSNSPSISIDVQNNQTAIVDGTYGDVTVEKGGILKGNGTVGNLYVSQGGIVAPGHSPGCLTVSGNYNQIGTYQAEIGGTTACSGYDQLDVTGTVTLDDGNTPPTQGTLQVSLVSGFTPKAGQTFEIINNEGSSAVKDTYSGLPEGSEITVSGYVFKISYVGGTGNDVVLTVVSVPKTPDTGFGLTSAHIGLPLLGATMMAGGIYFISRKVKHPIATKRR